jgi:hypothetical protein
MLSAVWAGNENARCHLVSDYKPVCLPAAIAISGKKKSKSSLSEACVLSSTTLVRLSLRDVAHGMTGDKSSEHVPIIWLPLLFTRKVSQFIARPCPFERHEEVENLAQFGEHPTDSAPPDSPPDSQGVEQQSLESTRTLLCDPISF